MSEQDKTLMAQYDITSEPKIFYRYKEHRYENLKDALNYARLTTKDTQENSPHAPIEK
jgi:hypothetical protein